MYVIISTAMPATTQLRAQQLQQDADPEADGDGDAHADPHLTDRVGPITLLEEGRDDADDQGSLESFAQTDDERRKHAHLLTRAHRRPGRVATSTRAEPFG
jgi:flagellar biosynthesis/type III secretory pathway M-ring protein FliF/YscJ